MSSIDPTDTHALKQGLARTYNHPTYDDPWEIVEEYQRVQEAAAEHPELGSSALSSTLDLPRARIRPWVDGDSRPDPVQGITTCDNRGWLVNDWDGPTLHNLTVLIAWIFSGGSITDNWVPMLSVTESTEKIAHELLKALVTRPETIRDSEQSRATEVRPTQAATALGRLCVVLGAPRGAKHSTRDLSLPSWLSDAPRSVRIAFARTYIMNRGTEREDREQLPLQFREERPAEYRSELRSFFEELVEGQAVRGQSETLYLTKKATRVLTQKPTIH